MRRLLYLSLFFLAALATAIPMPADKLPLGTVEKRDLVQQVTVAGTLVPNRRTVFNPPYNAYIKRLFVKTGDHVKAGDPVVELTQSLRGHFEEVFPLRAPFPGTVVQVLHKEGEYLETAKENNTMVRVDDLSRLFIESEVPESDIDKIKEGQQVMVKVNAVLGHPYHGSIREIALAAKERKDTRPGERVEFDVRMEITDKDALIRPGMSAIVDIITAKAPSVLSLPHEFILKNGADYFVTLENGEKRKVQVGLQNEEYFQIKGGLQENDRVRMVDYFSLPPPQS